MDKVQNQQRDGFTIIEVVLVLAIGALIMLMVFLALPAMQRTQRDTTRKNDMSRLTAAITVYKGQNRGKLPTNWEDFLTNYMRKDGDEFSDPAGGEYILTNLRSGGGGGDNISFDSLEFSDDSSNEIRYLIGGKCDFDANAVTGGNAGARKVAIIRPLEAGGVHCLDA